MLILVFAFVLAFAGTVSAVGNETKNPSTANLNSSDDCAGCDPIINGTVTINEYDRTRALPNATVIVNSSGRILGSATTDANGYYSISFFSNNDKFNVTTSYIGCAPITRLVTVTGSGTKTTTANFEMTPYTGYYTGTSGNPGSNVWIQADNMYGWAGLMNIDVETIGTQDAFCIDIFTLLNNNDKLLVNGPLPGTGIEIPPGVDWGKVNYIIKNYNPYTSNIEASAMQSAIWYFTSASYGPYSYGKTKWQFLTYTPYINSYQYDGMLQYATDKSAVVTRAWQMINAAQSINYPYQITLNPETTRVANGASVILTATVRDQNGNVLPNVTVNFSTDSGSLSSPSGTTDVNGQVSTILTGADNSTATVLAGVIGNYGNRLYDNVLDRAQNVVIPNLLSYTLRDYAFINFDVTANVTLSQTVNGITGSIPKVNVGDTVTFIVTALNTGPSTATGILIKDIIPAGLSNINIITSNGIGAYNSTTGIWTIASLANGASATLNITGIATAAMAGLTTSNTANRTAQDQNNDKPATVTEQVYTKKATENFTQTVNGGSSATVNVGDTVNYVITITNNGPDNATNVNINTVVPAGLTDVTINPSLGNYNTGVWTIGTFNSGSTATLTITGKAGALMAGTTTTNTATLSQNEYTPTTSTSTTVYAKKTDLTITQTVNTPVNVGNTVTYRVTVTNNGPDTAHNINIRDIIPAALGNPTVTVSTGTYNATSGIWTIPTLGLTSATMNITGTVSAAMAGLTTNNTATVVNQTEYDPTTATNTTGAYTQSADVVVTVTTSRPDIRVNTDYVTFTFTVTNYGPDTAHNIIVRVTEPALNSISRTRTSGTSYSTSTNPRTWTIPTLASGASATLNITGRSKTANVYRTGNATKTSQTEYDPSTPNNCTATIYVYTYKANVTVSQTVNGGSSVEVNVGDRVSFVISVKNNGPDQATGLVITDIIPAGLSNISYLASNGQATYNTTTGKWTIGTLNNAGTVTLTINGTVTSSLAGLTTINFANRTAQTTTQYNPSPASTNTTFYTKKSDVVLTQTINNVTGSIPQVNVGDTVTFMVKATNNGPDTATDVNITDILPLLENMIITPSNGAGAFNINTGRWTISSLTSGAYETLNITGIVTAAMAGHNTNNTATQFNQTEYDPTTSTTTEQFYTKKADVALTQSINGGNGATVNVGDTVTIVVTATNNGPDAGSNINIADALPAGFNVISITPQSGTSYSSGVWTIPNLAIDGSVTLTIIGNATAAMAGQTTNNTVNRTSQTEYNSLPGSNTAYVYTKLSDPIITQTVNGQDIGTLTVNVGDPLTFLINAYCSGPDNATNINISNVIPAGLTDVKVTPSVGTYNNVTGIWNIEFLERHTSAILNITGKAGAAMAGLNITNHAYEINQTEFNPYPGNSTSIPIYTKIADVTLTQTGSYQSNVVTFIVTATNNGHDTATNIKITDLIPAGLTGVVVTPSNGLDKYNSATGVWTIDQLGNGEFATLTIVGNATPQTTVYNTANKTNQTEYDPNTPDTTKIGVYVPGVNIGVFIDPWYYQDVDKAYLYKYVMGNTPVFMWNVVNSNSRDEATGVVAELIIPEGFEFVGASCGDYGTLTTQYNDTTKTWKLTWNIGYMPQSGNAMTYITLRVNAVGNRTAALTLTSNLIHLDQFDVNRVNDQNITCAIESPASADILVNQTYVKNGSQVVYTISVKNNGPSDSTGLQITDILPTGVTWVSDTSGGTYNHNTSGTGAGIWNVGNITSGDTKTLQITVNVTTKTGTIRNTAKITKQVESDTNYNNNGQSTYVTISGTYTPTTNIGIFIDSWYWQQSTQAYLYKYVMGNTPVFMWNVVNSNSRDEVYNAVAELIIPDGYEFVGASCGDYGTLTAQYNDTTKTWKLTWNIGYMPQSGNAMTYITLRVNAVGNQTAALTLTSNLTNGGQYDINHNNDQNITRAIESPVSADILVNQTYTTYTQNNNTYAVYTITVKNNGPSDSTGLQITDILPTGVTWDSDSSNGTYNYNTTGTGAGIWNVGNITSGNTKTLQITVLLKSTTTGTIRNTAKITTQIESDTNYNNNGQSTYITTRS